MHFLFTSSPFSYFAQGSFEVSVTNNTICCFFFKKRTLFLYERLHFKNYFFVLPPKAHLYFTAISQKFIFCPNIPEMLKSLKTAGTDLRGSLESIIKTFYTECPRRNVPDFGRVFLMLKYTDMTQNTYVQI